MSAPDSLAGTTAVDREIAQLTADAQTSVSLADRIALCRACLDAVVTTAEDWGRLALNAKGLPANSPLLAEDLLTGPCVVARQLQLAAQTLDDLQRHGQPRPPGSPVRLNYGQLAVPVFPTRGLFDGITFRGTTAAVWMQQGTDAAQLHGPLTDRARSGTIRGITAILGAGNVSSIPATDSLHKILFEGRRVLLKLNPVNEYLAPVLETALAPLIRSNLLRIVTGGIDVGHAAIHHADVGEIHITGSAATHDAIVWGPTAAERVDRKQRNDAVLHKAVTSELGNVTPWIVVPGRYSAQQLSSQAQHVAASITNNASFNCLATKMIVTWKDWPQRAEFLDAVRLTLQATPLRPSYYPGAIERYARFSGESVQPTDNGSLPWRLLTDQSIDRRPELFEQESFVCVCAETSLAAASPVEFLRIATDFVNDRMTGTLCASLTVTAEFRQRHATEFERALAHLRYGSVCVNQWSGLAYGLVSPPWGAWPGNPLAQVGSGIGSVHNTYLLEPFEKTVLEGPLVNFPQPVWFASHRNPVSVARQLLKLYHRPSVARLPGLFAAAFMG